MKKYDFSNSICALKKGKVLKMGVSTLLLIMFAIMFWIARIAIALVSQAGFNILGIVPMNLTYEIILIFITVLCLILIAKRKLLGSIIYLLSYGYYFGMDILNRVGGLASGEGMTLENTANIVVSFVGVVLAVAILLDSIVLKAKKGKPKNKKTDWFYGNEEFDRKFDERADRNEYKF